MSASFDQLDIERFSLFDGAGASRHFEHDVDLLANASKALGSGTQQAAVLATLGIDDYNAHRVQLDYMPGRHDHALSCIEEAIETLEVIRDQLAVLRSAPDSRSFGRIAA